MCYYDVLSIDNFCHDKSSSNSQLIIGISRYLQKLLRYLSEIITSTFKDDTGGCGGRMVSPRFPGHEGLSGVSPIFFLFYIQITCYPKPYPPLHRFCLCSNYTNFLMSLDNCDYIITNYTSTRLYQGLMHCLSMCCTTWMVHYF